MYEHVYGRTMYAGLQLRLAGTFSSATCSYETNVAWPGGRKPEKNPSPIRREIDGWGGGNHR